MMKTSIIKFAVVICASLALLNSCEYDIVVPEKFVPPPPGDTTVVISFSTDIQPIFNSKCVGCHPSVYKPDLTAANSYNALMSGNYVIAGNPLGSKLYTKCQPGGSMATYCSSEQLDLISRWIYADAKNN
jgi:hypothetical protein